MSLDFFHFLIHCSVNSSSPATTLPAAWAIYFPKTCTTNAALHVRTYRPLVAFSAYFTWMRFLTVNSTIDTFTLKVEQGWKLTSKLCHSILKEPFLLGFWRVGFQPWNPGYWRGLLTFMCHPISCSRRTPLLLAECANSFSTGFDVTTFCHNHDLGCFCIVQTGFRMTLIRIWSTYTWHDAIISNMMICNACV